MPKFLMDHSSARKMIEGGKIESELLEKFEQVKKEGVDIPGFITPAALLNAIYSADEEKFSVSNLQRLMNVLGIIVGATKDNVALMDFKNEEKVRNECMSAAIALSGEKKDGRS